MHADRGAQLNATPVSWSPKGRWETDVLAQIEGLFTTWHAFHDRATEHAGLQVALVPAQQVPQAALEMGMLCREYKICGFFGTSRKNTYVLSYRFKASEIHAPNECQG